MKLVTPQWLSENRNRDDVHVLDVRSDVMNFMPGHVHGAVHLSDFSLRAPVGGLPVQYLEPESLAHLFRRAGVRSSDTVVVYAEGAGVIGASMAMYALGLIGHTHSALLDGGWIRYRNEIGGTQEYSTRGEGDIAAGQPAEAMGVTLSEVKELIGQSGVQFVDSRPAGAYMGVEQTWMRNGHIPSALNMDWHDLVEGSNWHQLRPKEELEAVVKQVGLERDKDIVVYCGTSREASLAYFVLKHLLEFPRVRLYEGSWTEYCSYPELEAVTGPDPR